MTETDLYEGLGPGGSVQDDVLAVRRHTAHDRVDLDPLGLDTPDQTLDQVRAEDFDALVIPGGWAPDRLRRLPAVLELVRGFDRAQKPIAMICHAGWVPVSARILKGRQVTGVAAIRDDLENAGARYLDQSVVVDGHLISSRTPADLPDFCRALIAAITAKVTV